MKISDKLEKVDDSATVHFYDNGYLFEVSGRDHDEDWSSVKILCSSLDEVNSLLKEASTLPRS